MSDDSITVRRELIFDLMARLVAVSRHLALIDQHSSSLAATSAIAGVDHVGRELARLAGVPAAMSSAQFGRDPAPIAAARLAQPRAHVLVMPAPGAIADGSVAPMSHPNTDDEPTVVITSAPRPPR